MGLRNLTTLPLLVTGFLREFCGMTVTLLKRVLYKTFFNGNQFQATEKGNLLAR